MSDIPQLAALPTSATPQPGARKLSMDNRINLTRLAILIGLLGFWELASGRLFDLFWVSRPSLILQYMWEFAQKDFWKHFYFTMTATSVGFTLGALGGLLAGIFLSRSTFMAAVLDPFLVAING